MLKSLYVHNYRAVVNFSLELKPLTLLVGSNGSGKTTVLDVLAAIRALVDGGTIGELLPPSTLPRWLTGDGQRFDPASQKFELCVNGMDGVFKYLLTVEQRDRSPRTRIKSEQLLFNERPVFKFADGQVQLYRDDHSAGPEYGYDWHRSGLTTILPRHDNTRLTWLKEWLGKVMCVRVDAPRVGGRAEDSAAWPRRDLSNFAAWYREESPANSSCTVAFLAALKEVIGGLDGLDLKPAGQGVYLLVATLMGKDNKRFSLGIEELSDGQRSLVVLYALLHFGLRLGRTVCIDEPENFVALEEIQPWLMEVADQVSDSKCQAILISHHPELLNQLAMDHGILFTREGSDPVRTQPFADTPESALTPAERIARGWERG